MLAKMRTLVAFLLVVAATAMAQEGYVQLPPNSTGTKLRMRCNTISGNVVCTQSFFLDDGSGSGPLGLLGNPLYATFTNTSLAISGALPAGTNLIGSIKLTDGTNTAAVTAGGAVKIDGSAVTQPVSCSNCSGTVTVGGTITTTPPSNASTNVTQFGGNNIVTGTGASGSGVPRVTVASDSAIMQGTAAASTAPWYAANGTVTAATATWTSATGNNTCLGPITTTGMGSVAFVNQITGSVTGGTVTGKGSWDGGSTYNVLVPTRIDTTNGLVSSGMAIQTPAVYSYGVYGNMTQFEVCLNPVLVGSGSATLSISASAAAQTTQVGVGAIANTVTTNDVSSTSNGSAAPTRSIQIGATDGVNEAAARMKAASTAAVAADPSLVVAISPNSPATIMTGQATLSTASWTSATSQNTALTINTTGYATLTFEWAGAGGTITGGSLTYECSVDGGASYFGCFGTYTSLISSATFLSEGLSATTKASTFAIAGMTQWRARLSAVITGTGTITVNAIPSATSHDTFSVTNVGYLNGSGIATGNGLAGSSAVQRVAVASDNTAFGVKPTDGTTTITVKPASTAAVATDTAEVVTLSPNTALPAGANAIGSVTANIGTSGSLALDASVTGLQVSQGSTTSGQKGDLVQGAVTTGAPSYTTAQTSPLSLTTAGALRVDGSAVTQPANVAQVNGVATSTGNGVSGTGVQRVTLASDSTGQVTLATGANTIGALTANQSVNVNQVAGSAVSTAATGVQKVGIVGNTGATVDSTAAAGTAPTNAVLTSAIFNSTAPAPTTGQAGSLQADQAANLRIVPGTAMATLSAWNSSTGLNATQTIYSNSGVGAVMVHLVQTTTLTAGAITFEVSYDNTNWVTIPADSVLDPASTSQAQIAVPYTVQASTNKPFLIFNKGWEGLRIKLSTQITGTGTVTPNYQLLSREPVEEQIVYSPTAANFNATANISQFGGSNVVTGTGAGGSGIPRVTISNDSSLAANQSVNLAQVAGTNTVTAGVAGTLAVGGPNATNAAITGNPLMIGIEAQSGQPTAATTGNIRQALGALDGAQYMRDGGPVTWNCGLTGIAATLTQCQAAPAAGLKLYVTDIEVVSTTATGGQFLLRYGTGSNCVTGTTTLYPNIAAQTTGIMAYPANTVAPFAKTFKVPYAAAAANAVCVICVATNTCTIAMSGYTAP